MRRRESILRQAVLFGRDVKTIGKHIANALKEELRGFPVVAKFATTAADGKTYQVEHYSTNRKPPFLTNKKGGKFDIIRGECQATDYAVKGRESGERRGQGVCDVFG